jgi:serine/threonine protein kinase
MSKSNLFVVSRSAGAGAEEPSAAASHPNSSPSGTHASGGFTPSGASTLGPGTRIHQYELIRQIGSGGMGAVFLARDTRLGRRVAIKFLHSTDAETTRRFIVEAQTTARCSHENIVIIYEVGEFQGRPFMVLEYLQGQPLNKAVGGQRLPPARAVELMVPVVRALVAAHEQKIVHRDLKPENILVTDSGTIKVLDFGIAKVLQKSSGKATEATHAAPLPTVDATHSELTRNGVIVGTLAYMAPEQWRSAEVDARTDLWALGIILFRMLAGKHPLDPLRGQQLAVTAFYEEPMPSLRLAAPDVPADLAEVVDRCLRKRKDERFPDALQLLRALEPFLPGRYTRELNVDESPYAGLSSFQEVDAHRFFGRSREIAALVRRIQDRPLMAVVGPSGAGKSSFVRAGLVPALKRSGEEWETLVVRPGRQPLAALAHLVAPLVASSASIAEDLSAHQQLSERMRAEPGYVGSVLRSRARRGKRKILVFIDQFEELYTLVPDAAERLAFTACLSGIADDATAPMRVVLSIRSDFLDRVSEDEAFMAELGQGLFFLASPQLDGLRDALVQPAEMAGYQFEAPELVEDMLQYLAAAQGALPLLQFAATQLWEQRDRARKLITARSYQAIGGIAGALSRHADSVLTDLSASSRALVRSIFLRLVTPERTRAIASLEELRELAKDGAELQRLTDYLVQARLLVVQTGGEASGATVELVHESLIHSWPTLKRWLDENQEDSAFLEQLRNAARQWQIRDYDSGLLWGGEMVEEAQRFRRRYPGELPQLHQEFLEAVFAQAARATRRKRALLVGSTVFLSLLVAASAVALVVIRESKQEAVRQAEAAQRAEAAARVAEATARESEAAARQAEAAVRKSLEEVQAKELARQEAQAKVVKTQGQLASANAELQRINAQLTQALRNAKLAEWNARMARAKSDRNAREARLAKEEALRAVQELKKKQALDQQRIAYLEQQVGSIARDLWK